MKVIQSKRVQWQLIKQGKQKGRMRGREDIKGNKK